MLKRQITGSKHGLLRITNILEGNSRLVFTQFRLFKGDLFLKEINGFMLNVTD